MDLIIQTDKKYILYIGGLFERKGIPILIKAFNKILEEGKKNLYLKVVGDGEKRERIEQLVKELNLESKVIFEGWIGNEERLADIYTNSDYFLLPSIGVEGSPRVIDEAHFYGIPVITTILAYQPSIKDGENVIFVEPGNVEDLKSSLLKLINNKTLCEKLVKNGKKRMKEILKDTPAAQHAKVVKGNYLRTKPLINLP